MLGISPDLEQHHKTIGCLQAFLCGPAEASCIPVELPRPKQHRLTICQKYALDSGVQESLRP
jgi:hypothetical protein